MNSEIVKRWSSEVQEALSSKNPLVQYHALGLLHRIKQNDRLAVSKLVTQLSRSPLRSSLAQCLVIRYVAQVKIFSEVPFRCWMLRFHVFSKVIKDTKVDEVTGERPFFDFLESCLRHKSETVIFEAARLDLVSSQPFSKTENTPWKGHNWIERGHNAGTAARCYSPPAFLVFL